MIKAILVDDEENALKILELKIKLFFKDIEIVRTFQNPKEAIPFINNTTIDLLFIDVEMPVYSGFDVLSQLEKPDFEIIFVTAYNKYAIEAFKNCAIGYILKPIDNDELKSTIENAIISVNQKNNFTKNNALLELLIEKNTIVNKLIIPTNKGMSFIHFDKIIHIEGYDGYTKIHLTDDIEIVSSYNIGKYEKMLNDDFYKCHKSHIINLKKVSAFENEGYILLEGEKRVPVSKTKRKEFINLCSH
ncbi:LytR/AlgR family response regulator transcription factor [Polaribacter glomeratus]|uniref:DNA-binding response regulator n=1 Tax=Polaribacter glomeratus TaxID=102 RepID=A0A2S7WW05_9FLAO|nr:LytTR family DNA-binding domain-containing protein [Polaribacter glomeratus]PQJ81789.1 DNA-binding response regulator [Polaribacter glomeratus]TXD66287.1 response regulator transcription factor [Polaribacter glomeratus]